MIRILLLLCCVLIGMDFLEDYGDLEAYAENLGWLALAQRVAVTITALFIVVTEYLKIRSFNITMLVFLLVSLIYNPFYFLEVSIITKVAVIILFFIQALKSRTGKLLQ